MQVQQTEVITSVDDRGGHAVITTDIELPPGSKISLPDGTSVMVGRGRMSAILTRREELLQEPTITDVSVVKRSLPVPWRSPVDGLNQKDIYVGIEHPRGVEVLEMMPPEYKDFGKTGLIPVIEQRIGGKRATTTLHFTGVADLDKLVAAIRGVIGSGAELTSLSRAEQVVEREGVFFPRSRQVTRRVPLRLDST